MSPSLRLHGAACAACASLAPNACVVQHLGASHLSFDSTIGAAQMAVRFRESLNLEADELCADVWPDDSSTPVPPDAALLTLGHQQDAHGAMPCPASASVEQHPSPRLAAVALVVDSVRRCVLLTRRPRAMRTFPGAWVLPGGAVDAADASTAAAAVRELAEETGLTPVAEAATLTLTLTLTVPLTLTVTLGGGGGGGGGGAGAAVVPVGVLLSTVGGAVARAPGRRRQVHPRPHRLPPEPQPEPQPQP